MTVAPRRTTFWTPALLVLLFFGPMVVAGFMYFTGTTPLRPAGSVAHGTLIAEPGLLPEGPLAVADGREFKRDGRWTLIYVGGTPCEAGCQEGLYRMRQVRKALGRDDLRVQRLYVIADAGTPDAAFLAAQHPDLKVVDARTPARGEVLRSLGSYGPGDVFVADPLGNVILRFGPETPMKDMHKDLSLLLKASQIG